MAKHTFSNGRLSIRADLTNPKEKAVIIKDDIRKGKDTAKYSKAELIEALKQ